MPLCCSVVCTQLQHNVFCFCLGLRSSRAHWRSFSFGLKLGQVFGGDHGAGRVWHEIHSDATYHGGATIFKTLIFLC